MNEYDLFIPLHYNDGTPVEPHKLLSLQDQLLDEFGGLTVFPQPNVGYWRMAHVTYRDEIIILRVVARHTRAIRKFFQDLKQQLKTDLRQEEILIIVRRVETL